jgi:hypothetical protein
MVKCNPWPRLEPSRRPGLMSRTGPIAIEIRVSELLGDDDDDAAP